jgi:hypothetical protein
MNKKRILLIVLALVVAGGIIAAWQWNKPHRKAEDEKGIAITAVSLFNEYAANEAAANTKYLNKTLDVTGAIAQLDTNQDGQVALILKTDDLIGGVMCTMRDKNVAVTTGATVKVKGFCSGFLSDVKLTDCILDK